MESRVGRWGSYQVYQRTRSEGTVLLGGAEGVSKRAERWRGAAKELGGGPDLNLGERPSFLLIQAGQEGLK